MTTQTTETTLRIEARGGTTWAVYRGEEFLGTIECEGDSEVDADVIEAAEDAYPA